MYNYTTERNLDNFNFFNIKKELDYSVSGACSIDSRVLQICDDAEKNFLENQRAVKEIEKLKITDFKYRNNLLSRENVTRIYDPDDFVNVNMMNYEYSNNNNIHKDFNRKLGRDNNEISGNYINVNKSLNSNEINSKNVKIKNSPNFYNNNLLRSSNNKIQNVKIENYKIPIKHKHLKSGRKCKACELKKRIETKGEIDHVDHIKFKLNCDTNKLLLDTKSQMKKQNFKKAYEMLKLPISQGLYHSDIFYLFGEVSRILKKLEESEMYLLECLKFEHHSPFVFYSLGLLYQELLQYKYSVSFFKHFIQIIETADGYYELSKSYVGLKKNLKAAINITKAISMNKNVVEYYEFRASLYEMMGFSELAIEDKQFIRQLITGN